jgi:hypothetical protein
MDNKALMPIERAATFFFDAAARVDLFAILENSLYFATSPDALAAH